eukprot:m.212205 g.212205  ORF g.212205 m.212205 type:complete len:442 (+) comp19037_c0_seq8:239-1564(+)
MAGFMRSCMSGYCAARMRITMKDLLSRRLGASASCMSTSSSASPGDHQSPVVAELWKRRLEASGDFDVLPSLQSKSPQDSAGNITYDFANNLALQDAYRSPWDRVRIGRILEDMDAMAGTIAYDHCLPASPLLHIVTAKVDRIFCHQRADIGRAMALRGQVAWTGRTSMEIYMVAVDLDSDTLLMHANFTFVARSRTTGKAAAINAIVPSTPEEQEEFDGRAAKNERARQERGKHADVTGRNEHDRYSRMKHQLLAEAAQVTAFPALADASVILLRSTRLSNYFIAQNQNRNTSGRIFGGFLMRRAFELAFSTAYCFCGQVPSFVEVDEVLFLAPVNIGNLLRFESCVLYTEGNIMHVEVRTSVTCPEESANTLSNVFHFSFAVSSGVLKRVLPENELEADRIVARQRAEDIQHGNIVADSIIGDRAHTDSPEPGRGILRR